MEFAPHRCDDRWLAAAAKGIAAGKNSGYPDKDKKYIETRRYEPVRLGIIDNNEELCEKAVWEYVHGSPTLKEKLEGNNLANHLKLLAEADEAFNQIDSVAKELGSAADAVYEAAIALGLASGQPGTLMAQAGITKNGYTGGVAEVLSARGITLNDPSKIVADEATAGKIAPILGADSKVGPVVKAFNTALVKLYGEINRQQAAKKLKLDPAMRSVTLSNVSLETLDGVKEIAAAMADADATAAGAKWRETGAQSSAALSRYDTAIRNFVAMHVHQVRQISAAAAAIKPKAKVEPTPNNEGGDTLQRNVTQLESDIKKGAADQALAHYFDGGKIEAPKPLAENASADDKRRHQDQTWAWGEYQRIQAGHVSADGKNFIMTKPGANGAQVEVKVPITEGESADSVASRVAQIILTGGSGEAEAALGAVQNPDLSGAGGVSNFAGPSATTGLKSDRPSCGSDKLTQSDLAAEKERDKKKKIAKRSASRQEAEQEYINEGEAAQREYEECANIIAGKRKIARAKADEEKCRKERDARLAEAKKDYEAALKKYGSSAAIAADQEAVGDEARAEAEKDLKRLVMRTVSEKHGNWRATPSEAFKHALDDAARQWARERGVVLVEQYFQAEWKRGPKYDLDKADPDNDKYKANIADCLQKGVRSNDSGSVVARCVGPKFGAWLEEKIAAASKGEVQAVTGDDRRASADEVECRAIIAENAKNARVKIPEKCKKYQSK